MVRLKCFSGANTERIKQTLKEQIHGKKYNSVGEADDLLDIRDYLEVCWNVFWRINTKNYQRDGTQMYLSHLVNKNQHIGNETEAWLINKH